MPRCFKRQQGRVYFQTSDRHLGLISGRLFCARDPQALDVVLNLDEQAAGQRLGGHSRDVMEAPLDGSSIWADNAADVRGLAVAADGVVVLHEASVEGLSLEGQSLWTVGLPAAPVRWGLALTGKQCVVDAGGRVGRLPGRDTGTRLIRPTVPPASCNGG